jgi:CxxC motif-containing protein (DUF1111 family)
MPPSDDSAAPTTFVNAADVPINGTPGELVRTFDQGDTLFDLPFRAVDGLGPLYIRTSCGACHESGARGPGLVQKMSVVEADGVTASPDQSLLTFGHTVRRGLTAGATTPLVPPDDASVKVSTRVGPPVFGRGYIEAVAPSEIERVEAEQAARADGIHGRINRVVYSSQENPDTTFAAYRPGDADLIGRFGVKARIATVDDFVADAFQGDMGLTTPMRPSELPNPEGLLDDERTGVDLDVDHVNQIADYLRLIAIPPRVGMTKAGAKLFADSQCGVCHVPSMKTRDDYPLAVLAGIDANIYSDLLLHDMGDGLADGMVDGQAGSRDWRTPTLIGVRFDKTFLHDGRTTTVEDAILAHDGEGAPAREAFSALSSSDRQSLLDFVEAL